MLGQSRAALPLVCVFFASTLSVARAAEPPSRAELSKMGKAATAFVEVRMPPRRLASGTAFCIHPTGLFITNDHVVTSSGDIRLVLNAGEKAQRIVNATVVRRSRDPDLALLRVTGVDSLPVLSLGSADGLVELGELVAFGFPFGNALALAKGSYPSISVNSGRITSLRKQNGQLHLIQVDVVLNPGNSGGPVLDANGNVVGVVFAGLRGAGVNFIIPVNAVKNFLAKPEISLTPPSLARASLYQPGLFRTRVVQIVPNSEPLKVEMLLQAGNEPARRHAMKLSDGVFEATAALAPKPAEPRMLRLDVRFVSSALTGAVADQTFTVDGKGFALRDVRRLQGTPKVQVVLRDGRTLEGTLAGLDAVPVSFGKQQLRLNLAHAAEASIEPPEEITSVSCTIVVSQSGKEIARHTESLKIPAQ